LVCQTLKNLYFLSTPNCKNGLKISGAKKTPIPKYPITVFLKELMALLFTLNEKMSP